MAKLYFYYSAMNAGKSTMLLQASYNYHERGMATLIFTPQIDDRYAVGQVHSRIGLSQEAIAFSAQDNLLIKTQTIARNFSSLACVLVDEAQFLSKEQVMQLAAIADELNIPVLTYGLRTDYRGEPFSGSQYLLGFADELIEIKTVCHCGRKATMNMRVDSQGRVIRQGDPIHIGGNESYIATCRKHFLEGKTQTCRAQKPLSFSMDERQKAVTYYHDLD